MYRVLHLVILCKNEQEDLVDTAIFVYLQLYLWYKHCMKFNFSSFFQMMFNRENNAETVFDSGQEIYITVGVRKPVC